VRRAARTAACGTAGLLIAALLGWAAAVMVGLTEPAEMAGTGVEVPRAQVGDAADPAFERTLEASGRGARGSEETPTPAPGPTADQPAPAAGPADGPATPSSPEQSVVPTPTPVPTVSAGDACRAEGARGVTDAGRPVVCIASPGNGKTRWRHA
jgi:hypothetical protein